MPTTIEWTDETWNPTTGCTRASAGCDHCYAVPMTRRLAGYGNAKYAGLVNPGKGHFNGTVRTHPDALDAPLRWRRPRRVFVNSMSDLFHKDVPFEFVAAVFGVMAECPRHTFQVLTKRPERAAEFFRWVERETGSWAGGLDAAAEFCAHRLWKSGAGVTPDLNRQPWPLPNVWLGTSVEDQDAADERVPHLLRCPAAVRFLSCEPLLGPVDLDNWLWEEAGPAWAGRNLSPGIDWVIVGGESGPGARPMDPAWAVSLRDQCAAADVPLHFKQWGKLASNPHPADPTAKENGGEVKGGRMLDGCLYDGFPEPA